MADVAAQTPCVPTDSCSWRSADVRVCAGRLTRSSTLSGILDSVEAKLHGCALRARAVRRWGRPRQVRRASIPVTVLIVEASMRAQFDQADGRRNFESRPARTI